MKPRSAIRTTHRRVIASLPMLLTCTTLLPGSAEAHDLQEHVDARLRRVPEPHIGPYPPGQNVLQLQSLPKATKIIFLDLETIMDGDTPIGYTHEDIWHTWQSVASALSMFEVNVTTDRSIYETAKLEDTGRGWFGDCERQLSPFDSFGTSSAACVHSFADDIQDGYVLGRTAAHELGHILGLNHQSSADFEYFPGFPEFRWVPLEGNYYSGDDWGEHALYQWSKSEFAGAGAAQDDLALIHEHLPYRDDDIPTTVPLVVNGGRIDPLDNRGQISVGGDQDTFEFSVHGPQAELQVRVDRTEYIGGAMLDVQLELLDSTGSVVASHNPRGERHAEIELELGPGDYRLVIRGGAEGSPEHGFSSYGSLGFYAISGRLVDEGSTDTGEETDDDDTGADDSSDSDESGTTAESSGGAGETDSGTDESSSMDPVEDASTSEGESPSDMWKLRDAAVMHGA